jgi:hypothetical protein
MHGKFKALIISAEKMRELEYISMMFTYSDVSWSVVCRRAQRHQRQASSDELYRLSTRCGQRGVTTKFDGVITMLHLIRTEIESALSKLTDATMHRIFVMFIVSRTA